MSALVDNAMVLGVRDTSLGGHVFFFFNSHLPMELHMT